MRLGPVEVSGIVHRGGFDASLYIERAPHPEWGFRRQLCVFAVWWARGCDAGLCLLGRRLTLSLHRPRA